MSNFKKALERVSFFGGKAGIKSNIALDYC